MEKKDIAILTLPKRKSKRLVDDFDKKKMAESPYL